MSRKSIDLIDVSTVLDALIDIGWPTPTMEQAQKWTQPKRRRILDFLQKEKGMNEVHDDMPPDEWVVIYGEPDSTQFLIVEALTAEQALQILATDHLDTDIEQARLLRQSIQSRYSVLRGLRWRVEYMDGDCIAVQRVPALRQSNVVDKLAQHLGQSIYDMSNAILSTVLDHEGGSRFLAGIEGHCLSSEYQGEKETCEYEEWQIGYRWASQMRIGIMYQIKQDPAYAEIQKRIQEHIQVSKAEISIFNDWIIGYEKADPPKHGNGHSLWRLLDRRQKWIQFRIADPWPRSQTELENTILSLLNRASRHIKIGIQDSKPEIPVIQYPLHHRSTEKIVDSSGNRVTQITKRTSQDMEVQILTPLGDTFGIRSHDQADPDFLTALEALRDHVLDILELPRDYGRGLSVVGIKVKIKEAKEDGDEDLELVQIIAEKSIRGLENPFKITTPASHYDGAALKDLNDLYGHALAFVEGKRSRIPAFEEPDPRQREQLRIAFDRTEATGEEIDRDQAIHDCALALANAKYLIHDRFQYPVPDEDTISDWSNSEIAEVTQFALTIIADSERATSEMIDPDAPEVLQVWWDSIEVDESMKQGDIDEDVNDSDVDWDDEYESRAGGIE